MKKNSIACFAAGAVLFGTIGVFAGQYVATDNPFSVKLNGNDVQIEGYNIEGSTYFKLRDIADTVGGFEVGFQDNTIQLSKDGYVYGDKSDFVITDEIKNDLIRYSTLIPEFVESDVTTTQFADDFIFYFYTGIETDKEKRTDDLYYGWSETEVQQQYKLLFGKDLPKTTTNLEDGYYWVHVSNAGEGDLVFDNIKEAEDRLEVTFRVEYDNVVYNKTTYTLKQADNEKGYIITSKVVDTSMNPYIN